MVWVKLDDGFPRHPKVLEAGPEAAWLHICGLCYSSQYLTNGNIPESALLTLAAVKRPELLAKRLEDVGLWHRTEAGWSVNDYLDFNPSRDEVLSAREARRMAGLKGAASRWHGKPHDQSHPDRIDNADAPGPSRRGTPPNKGSRIPESFEVTPEMAEWATREHPTVDWDTQTKQFVDHFKSKPGKDAVKLDWERAWKVWIRRQATEFTR